MLTTQALVARTEEAGGEKKATVVRGDSLT